MSEKIVQLNEEVIKGQIKELVRGSVEETLNALLETEAEKLTQAARYERSEARQGYRGGHYDRNLTTTSGDVTLHTPCLKGVSFETAIIERYRRRKSSVEEALIEIYLAGVSVRRVEDITEALWGSKVSPATSVLLNFWISVKIKLGLPFSLSIRSAPLEAMNWLALVLTRMPQFSGELAADLLRQKHHRVAFAAALGVPEYAQLAVVQLSGLIRLDRLVDAQILMVAGKDLCRASAGVVEEDEIFKQVEEIFLFADSPQHGFQSHAALLLLGQALPLNVSSDSIHSRINELFIDPTQIQLIEHFAFPVCRDTNVAKKSICLISYCFIYHKFIFTDKLCKGATVGSPYHKDLL